MLIMTEIRLIRTATHRPESNLTKFVPLKRTSIPKFCMAKSPFQQVSENGYWQKHNQIKDDQKHQAFNCLGIHSDKVFSSKHAVSKINMLRFHASADKSLINQLK